MDLIVDQLFECLMGVITLLADVALWLSEALREEK
jgi:hypothetical protein